MKCALCPDSLPIGALCSTITQATPSLRCATRAAATQVRFYCSRFLFLMSTSALRDNIWTIYILSNCIIIITAYANTWFFSDLTCGANSLVGFQQRSLGCTNLAEGTSFVRSVYLDCRNNRVSGLPLPYYGSHVVHRLAHYRNCCYPFQ